MAVIHGKKGVVMVGANTVARVQSFNLNRAIGAQEVISMGDEWKDHETDYKDWNVSLTCLYDPADTTGQGALTIDSQISLKLYPEGTDTGKPEFSGTATILGSPISQTKESIVEISFEAKGKGALTEGTVS